MSKDKITSRRHFIAAGGAGSISVLSGCIYNQSIKDISADIANDTHKSASSKLINYKNINVSLFQTRKIYNTNRFLNGASHTLKLCKNYIEKELSKIGQDIQINVKIIESPVELDTDNTGRSAYHDWQKHFQDNIPIEHKSRDSNLLISNIRNDEQISGVAEKPCLCHLRSSTAMTFNSIDLAWYEDTKIRKDIEYLEGHLSTISTVLHEVGHNLGFKHNMGYGWYDEGENIIKSTPMLSLYINKMRYAGENNYFGDRIVNPDNYDVPIKKVPYLNPKLSHDNVEYEFIND